VKTEEVFTQAFRDATKRHRGGYYEKGDNTGCCKRIESIQEYGCKSFEQQ
jgi:hypothetical protein